MGKKARLRKARQQATREPVWSATAAARRAHHLTAILTSGEHLPHLYGMLPNMDPQLREGAATFSFILGMPIDQWASEVQDMVRAHHAYDARERSVRFRLTEAEYTAQVRHLQTLIPQGMPLPADAQPFVISPDMHDTVLAAALTLSPADLATLDPATDLPAPSGTLLLPTPLEIGNDRGTARISVLTWRTAPIRTGTSTVESVITECYTTREDNTAPAPCVGSFRSITRNAKVLGLPAPRLTPAHLAPWPCAAMPPRQVESMLAVTWPADPDDRANDRDDVAAELQIGSLSPRLQRQSINMAYLFAFWRLCNQPVTDHTTIAPPTGSRTRATTRGVSSPADRIHVVHLRRPAAAGTAPSARLYQHRWVVRMHKVRQWHPKQGVHKVIWRGPYIKGPDGAPLLESHIVHALTH